MVVGGGHDARQRRTRRPVAQPHNPHIAAGFERMRGQHPAIATIVAGTAQHRDAMRLRPHVQQLLPRGLPRAAHQGVLVHASHALRALFEFAQRGVGIERERPGHAAILYFHHACPERRH